MTDINFLKETKQELSVNGKSFDDVLWVGSENFGWMSKEVFARLAAKIDYDPGYGTCQIPLDLKIVGNDWWLERCEYDGSEWWNFKSLPIRPSKCLDKEPSLSLIHPEYCHYDSLSDLNPDIRTG